MIAGIKVAERRHCERLFVGQLVIANEYDRPEGLLVAVVCSLDAEGLHLKYLANVQSLHGYSAQNDGLGMLVTPERWDRVTSLEEFGVQLQMSAEMTRYCCIQTRRSIACYPHGKHRDWQGNMVDVLPARKELLRLVLQQARGNIWGERKGLGYV